MISTEPKLKKIFTNSRLLSYLFLDSQYVEVPISFDLSKILLEFPEHIEPIFKDPNSQIIKTLDSFEDFLSINMYHSADSIRELGYHSRKIEKKLEDNEEELKETKKLREYLKDDLKFVPDLKKRNYALKLYILFDIGYLDLNEHYNHPIEVFNKVLYEIEEKWNKNYSKICEMTYQPGSNKKHLPITLSFLEDNAQKNLELLGRFLEEMVDLKYNIIKSFEEYVKRSNTKGIGDIAKEIENIFRRPYQELLIEILKYSTDKLFFEYKNENPRILTIRDINELEGVQQIIEEEADKEDRWRANELRVLKTSLDKFKESLPKIILPLSQITASDYKKKLAEVDGFGFAVKNGFLGVLLIEAKIGPTSKSKRCLRKKFGDLNFKSSLTPDIDEIYMEDAKGVYSCLKLMVNPEK